MDIQEMRGRRNHLMAQTKELLDKSKGNQWTAENQTQYDGAVNEISDIDSRLARHQQMLDLAAEKNFGDAAKKNFDDKDPKNTVKVLHNKWLRGGDNAITAEEWQVIRNTMSTTTTTEGGYTVPVELSSLLIEKLKGYVGVRQVAQSLVTATGAQLSYPTSDGTSEIGEIIAENTTATAQDPVFGTVALNVWKYSSKIIAVPFELLQDTTIDMEAFINNRIRDRLGRIQNTHFTVGAGSGSSQPNGLITASSVGKVGATTQTTTITYDDLIDLIDSLDYIYQTTSCKWMFAQSSRKVLRKIKDTTGRPIWAPGEGNLIDGFSESLLGFGIQLNNDVPAMAANAKSVAFGDFSKYIVRDAAPVSLFRFTDSAYTKLGQVGFLAWQRSGGNLIDVNAVKLYQNAAS
ncbi:MAG: phage major capsid protein [Verrucomicrobiaceae bacterium]|nr:phage major capsid protein [Verrucomicrobiaceae bacterium]